MPESPPPAIADVVIDAYATLGLPKKLALDETSLDAAWRENNLRHHPDRPGGDAALAAAANQARETLRRPASRLRHWLTLHGATPSRSAALDPTMMDLFSVVAESLGQADEVLRRKAAASTAIGRAAVAAAELRAQLRLQELQGRLTRSLAECLERFKEIDARAEAGDAPETLLRDAQSLAGTLAFLEKWEAQCREKLLALATSAL